MSNTPKVTLEDRSLACTLTFEERERKGTELARASADVERLEAEKKAAQDSLKSQITAAEGRVHAIASVLNQGYEYREVRCRRMASYFEQRLTVVREDTGEVVENRPLNPKELRELELSMQQRLPLGEPVEPRRPDPAAAPTVTLADDSASVNENPAPVNTDTPGATPGESHGETSVPDQAAPDIRMPHEILADMTRDVPNLAHLVEVTAYGQLELALSALSGKHGGEARRVAIKRELRKRGRTEPELPPLEDKRECACGHVAEKHYAINDHLAGCSVKGCPCTKFVEVQELFGEDAPEPEDDGDYDAGEDFDEAT